MIHEPGKVLSYGCAIYIASATDPIYITKAIDPIYIARFRTHGLRSQCVPPEEVPDYTAICIMYVQPDYVQSDYDCCGGRPGQL